MHRGFTITSKDLGQVLCLSADRESLVMRDVNSSSMLNKAFCVHDLTEAKNVLNRLLNTADYKELAANSAVTNIARLYNKFF